MFHSVVWRRLSPDDTSCASPFRARAPVFETKNCFVLASQPGCPTPFPPRREGARPLHVALAVALRTASCCFSRFTEDITISPEGSVVITFMRHFSQRHVNTKRSMFHISAFLSVLKASLFHWKKSPKGGIVMKLISAKK